MHNTVTEDRIRTAIEQLNAIHPALSAVVEIDTDQEYSRIKILDPIDINSVLTFIDLDLSNDEQIGRYLEQLHQNEKWTYSAQKPLWKVIVCNHRTVFFLFDHGLMDGRSGAIFIRDLSQILDGQKNQTNQQFDTIHPAMDEYVINSCGPRIAQVDAPAREPTFTPFDFEFEHRQHRTTTISKEIMNTILEACRVREVTFTAYLCSCVVALLSEQYPSNTGFLGMIPIDSRRYFEPDYYTQNGQHVAMKDTLGAYIFQFRYTSAPVRNLAGMWDCAKDITTKLRQNLAGKPGWLLSTIPTLHVRTLAGNMLKLNHKPRDIDFIVSNLGLVDLVGRLGFSQPHSPIMAALKLNVIGSNDGVRIVLDATKALNALSDVFDAECAIRRVKELIMSSTVK
ncbi:hypothetical protein V1512DRAFT_247378 [Lipomyces arxii]|uniref:uncharacterized protein n=1 Tax=Lipomyces arxii TaxID=56418 RepID=UPI0034CF41F7